MKALCRASFEEANTQHLDRIIGVLVGTTSTREEYHRAGMELLATLHTDAALAYEPAPTYEAPSSATEPDASASSHEATAIANEAAAVAADEDSALSAPPSRTYLSSSSVSSVPDFPLSSSVSFF
jgi:hypothetical protein